MRRGLLLILLWLCAGCAASTDFPARGTALPMKEDEYQKFADIVREEHERLADIAVRHLRDTTTDDSKIGLGCLARADIDQVYAEPSVSSPMRDLLVKILGTLEKHQGECPTLSGQWNFQMFRWNRANATAPAPREEDDIGGALLKGAGQGAAEVLVVYALAAYAGVCVASIGLVCPLPGDGYEVHLSAMLPDTATEIDGIGIAQGSTNITAWTKLREDREAFALALAESLKALATKLPASAVPATAK